MMIYEWTHVNKWGTAYTIQCTEKYAELARQKAIKHLEETNWNRFLLEKVRKDPPVVYTEGIQTILEVPYEEGEIKTY